VTAGKDTELSVPSVTGGHFPAGETFEEQFSHLLRYVILAPSTFNTQPWKFRVTSEGIEIFGDYSRRMPIADPGNRELLISIGAAVMNLRVAAAHHGFACFVTYNYSGSSEEPLAFARLIPHMPSDAVGRRRAQLWPRIPQRHTDRNAFLGSRIPAAVVHRIQQCAVSSDASVAVSVDGSLNERIAGLVARGDQIVFDDLLYRKNIADWLRGGTHESKDGVPGMFFGFDHRLTGVPQWLTPAVDAGKARAAHDRNLCLDAPGLIVVCSDENVPAWLAAGELLEEVLLTLTAEGVHHSYLNVPVHLPELRAEVKQLLSVEDWPQLLLRIGYSLDQPVTTSRRPLDEVLLPARPVAHSAFTI
jgi:hypothetical protein